MFTILGWVPNVRDTNVSHTIAECMEDAVTCDVFLGCGLNYSCRSLYDSQTLSTSNTESCTLEPQKKHDLRQLFNHTDSVFQVLSFEIGTRKAGGHDMDGLGETLELPKIGAVSSLSA